MIVFMKVNGLNSKDMGKVNACGTMEVFTMVIFFKEKLMEKAD